MVLVMQARQGSSETVVMVMQYLEQKKRDNSIRIDMEAFFEAMKEKKGWDRAATKKLIQRGRSLFKLANLRPEEVLCVRMYTVRVLALVHVFSLTLRLYSSLRLGFTRDVNLYCIVTACSTEGQDV
jgi:hypothetical protein